MTAPTPIEHNLLDQIARADSPLGSELFHGLVAHGHIDVDALADAFRALAERNDGLRTGFRQVGEGWVRFVVDAPEVPVEVCDLRDHPTPEAAGAERARAFRFTPLPLDVPPLARVLLVRIADDTTWLIRHGAHVAVDGWSVVLLNEEVSARYRAQVDGTPLQLPPRGSGAALAAELCRPHDPEHVRWWMRRPFAGARFTGDRDAPPDTVAGHAWAVADEDGTRTLEATCARVGVSVRAAVCVAWARATAPLAAVGAGGVHVAYANRRDPARRATVGYLSVSVPVQVPLEGPAADRLTATMTALREGQRRIDALPAKPASGTIVDWHHVADYAAGLDLPGVTFLPLLTLPPEVHHMFVHYDLELHSVRAPTGLVHLVRYRRDRFQPATVAALLERHQAELAALAQA